jgi:hypothetical protein
MQFTKVSDFIIPIIGSWDEELLETLFLTANVQRILEIPLNNQGFDDFISWHYNKNGKYSVRSGYHLQWKHAFGVRAGQLVVPRSLATNPIWKVLW